MPYIKTPNWAKILFFVLYLWLYTFTLLAAIWAAFLTPATIGTELSFAFTKGWGLVGIVASICALGGVISRRYRWEWSALPFIATGFLIYAITVYSIMGETITRGMQAFVVSSLVIALTIRFVDLTLVRLKYANEKKLYDKDA